MTCGKLAETIEVLSVVWTQVTPKNHALGGGQIPFGMVV